jgi:hypothetical protein
MGAARLPALPALSSRTIHPRLVICRGKRHQCNLCNMPKPGTLDVKREGLAGGFKELDEHEVEEARRRRREFEEKDM